MPIRRAQMMREKKQRENNEKIVREAEPGDIISSSIYLQLVVIERKVDSRSFAQSIDGWSITSFGARRTKIRVDNLVQHYGKLSLRQGRKR